MKIKISFTVFLVIFLIMVSSGCYQQQNSNVGLESSLIPDKIIHGFPHIAGYISDGEDLLNFETVCYDIVYSSSIDQDITDMLRLRNSNTVILYQSPLNYMFDSAVSVIEATTGLDVTDDFWLKDSMGNRCGYGWTPEMYAIDVCKSENVEIMSLFFSNILQYQSQYDGLFFDVLEETSRCDSVSDSVWVENTALLLKEIRQRIGDKIILANSGFNYDENNVYLQYLNGFAMESFLSGGAGFTDGFDSVDLVLKKTLKPHFLIFTVYSINTVTKEQIDSSNMRFALTLSMLFNNTYLCYAESLDEVGSFLWPDEFSAEIGEALGSYYVHDNAYWRDFENGYVVCSPENNVTVSFNEEYKDISSGEVSTIFSVGKGDGKIFIKR